MVWLLLAGLLQAPPAERVTPLGGVALTLTLDKDVYEVGEPIVATLRLTNRSSEPVLMPMSSEITGRHGGYVFEIRGADGPLLQDPHNERITLMHGIGTDDLIEPSRWRVRELTLNHRVPVLEPGRYTVKATFQQRTPVFGTRSTGSPAVSFQVVTTPPSRIRERVARLRHRLAEGDDAPSVARLLGFTGHPDAIAPLVDLLYAPNEQKQVAAVESLLYLDRTSVREALLQALRERGPRSRMVHLLVVELRPPPEQVRDLLLPWLSDRNDLTRAAAVEGLALSNTPNPDPRLFARLVDMLRDPAELVRLPATNGVGGYQNADSLGALKPLVKGPDGIVRLQAIIAVGWVAQAATLPLAVRQEAVEVLREVERAGGHAAEEARRWLAQAAAKGSVPSHR